ncbi:MAG: hypothetical protein N2C14_19505 [Planctomycetales bacterium]
MIDLVEPHSQTDPKFQGLFKYTRLTAKAVHAMLIKHKNYSPEQLPHVNTIGSMLNRMGYKMRRVLKAKPQKKSPKPTPFSTTSTSATPIRTRDRIRCESPSTPKPC